MGEKSLTYTGAFAFAYFGAVLFTLLLWGYAEELGPGKSERLGLFGYKETEIVGHDVVPWHEYPSGVPLPNAPNGARLVTRHKYGDERYDTPRLAATIAITVLIWGTFGLCYWRLKEKVWAPLGVQTRPDAEAS